MLPSCASCNLRKHSKDLLECITTDLTYDLSTASKDVTHLNTAARNKIVMALKIKHNRQQDDLNDTHRLNAILSEIEQNVAEQTAFHTSSHHTSSNTPSQWSDLDSTRIDRADLLFDETLTESDAISSGAFGEIHMGKFDLTAHSRKTKERAKLRLQKQDGEDTVTSDGTPVKGIKPRPSLGGAQFSTLTQAVVAITGSTPEKGSSTFLANSSTHVDVAIKLPVLNRAHIRSSLISEIRILSTLQTHANIVTCYGWFPFGLTDSGDSSSSSTPSSSPSMFGIVLEYCSHNLSMTNCKRHVNPLKIFAEVASALLYMHSKACIHRDLKPHNILVHKVRDQPWALATAKLCDFGSAKYTLFGDSQEKHTYNAGTAAFRPPEVKRGILVPESDVYSLGVTMYEVSMDNNALLGDRDLYAAWQTLYSTMRTYNYHHRPSAQDVSEGLTQLASRDFSAVQGLAARKKSEYATLNAALLAAQRSAEESLSAEGESGKGGKKSVSYQQTSSAVELESETVFALPTASTAPRGNDDDLEVYLSSTGRCRENPNGTRRMKYHSQPTCRHIVKKSATEGGLYSLPVSEARDEFKHTACKTCKWPAAVVSGVSGVSEGSVNEEEEEDELESAVKGLKI
eukprot:gene25233-31664_t